MVYRTVLGYSASTPGGWVKSASLAAHGCVEGRPPSEIRTWEVE